MSWTNWNWKASIFWCAFNLIIQNENKLWKKWSRCMTQDLTNFVNDKSKKKLIGNKFRISEIYWRGRKQWWRGPKTVGDEDKDGGWWTDSLVVTFVGGRRKVDDGGSSEREREREERRKWAKIPIIFTCNLNYAIKLWWKLQTYPWCHICVCIFVSVYHCWCDQVD